MSENIMGVELPVMYPYQQAEFIVYNAWQKFDVPPPTGKTLEFWSPGHDEIKVGYCDADGVVHYVFVAARDHSGCFVRAIGLECWRYYKPVR